MKTQFVRTAHIIRSIEGDIVFEGKTKLAKITNKKGEVVQEACTIPSISKAKKESRRLQTAGLGRGQLKVA